MASSYPGALDGSASIPGYVYVDDIEFVTAEQANAWVSCIQAIEGTIGYGQGHIAANPLWSVAYTEGFNTISDRISATENKVVNFIQIDTSAADIQPIGVTAAAGSTGKAADAGHIHSGIPTSGLIPIGGIVMWAGSTGTFPSGYLQCNGQLISRVTYSTLFSLIGTTYGSGAGTFGLPSFNDLFPIGIGSVFATGLNQTGGSQTISQDQMPAHTHGMSWLQQPHNHVPASSLNPANPAYNSQFVIGPLPTSTLFINFGSLGDHGSYPAIGVNITYEPFGTNAVTDTVTSIVAATTGGGQAYTPPYIGFYFLMRVQ